MTKKEIYSYLEDNGCDVSWDNDGDIWVGFPGSLEQVVIVCGNSCYFKEPEDGISSMPVSDVEPKDLKTIVDFYGGK